MGGSEALYVALGGLGYIYIFFLLIMIFDLHFYFLLKTFSYQFLATYNLNFF